MVFLSLWKEYSVPLSLKFSFPVYIKWLITMLALLIGWVLFRSPDLKYAGEYLGIMFGFVRAANMAQLSILVSKSKNCIYFGDRDCCKYSLDKVVFQHL